ncbi:MAG: hypothetical protein WAX38_00055 [Minisyncoccia bacterium]
MNDIGYKLFGKNIRTELIRFFALNATRVLSFEEISAESRIKPKILKDELASLKRAGIVDIVTTQDGKRYEVSQGEHRGIIAALFGFSFRAEDERLVTRIKKAGKVKLVVCAGRMVGDDTGSIDMLIVGDIKTKILETAVKQIEERTNTELRCAVFSETEFLHRLDMRDRLVFETLQSTHRVLLNKTKAKLHITQ